ncbi:penicillin-binding protein [Methylobacterium sp. SD21]|uniref:penicillin-binding protein n=1 Tax=Methylobacterium litchii TaxID=3138810 RepID=UPI00313DF678
MPAALTRRSALAAAVALITYRAVPVTAAPIYAAIRRAEAADAADREAGRLAHAMLRAGRPFPAGWKPYRAGLRQARSAARFELHALTPSTAEAAAAALIAYYHHRAATSGEPATAHHAAQRRLRKVFRRPGAVVPAAFKGEVA